MALKDRIRSQIESNGPMPFEDFMELALYDPEHGYFGAGALRSEKAGDFLTSPEVSDLFGEVLAAYVDRERSRIGDPFRLVEVGAGSGSLMRPLLKASSVEAWAVEASPAARRSLQSLIPPDRVLSELPERIRGVVIANELIDNLPMALAQRVDGTWRERRVGIDGESLGFVDAAPRPDVARWLSEHAGDVAEGGWVEAQMTAAAWLRDTLGRLEAGSIVLFDYGDTAENLLPRRQDGTLRTYRAHHLTVRTTSSTSSGWGNDSPSFATPSWRQLALATKWSGSASGPSNPRQRPCSIPGVSATSGSWSPASD